MEVIHYTNGEYVQYEDLIMLRDQYQKDADQYHFQYISEFGELTTKLFGLKVDCIALKRSISFCLKAINHGQMVDIDKMNQYVDTHLASYKLELKQQLNMLECSKKMKAVPISKTERIKKLYRQIAKMLHPDLTNLVSDYPDLSVLFQEAMDAYNCNDLKRLEEVAVCINAKLEELGVNTIDVVIPNVEERIERIEEEINTIITTPPYTYKEILSDFDKTEELKKQLSEEIEETKKYKDELQITLDEMLKDGESCE